MLPPIKHFPKISPPIQKVNPEPSLDFDPHLVNENSIFKIQPPSFFPQIMDSNNSASNPKKDLGRMQVGSLENIKNDIYVLVKNNVNSSSPFFADIMSIINDLKDEGEVSDDFFICPWYITMIFLEILSEHSVILKIHSSLKGVENLKGICQNFEKYLRVILYLVAQKDLSSSCKCKILRQLPYNITILNEKTQDNKTTLIELLLMKEDFDYMDLLIKEAKSAENCKAHAIEEMENTIITEIAHKIISSKTSQIFRVWGLSPENSPKKKESPSMAQGLNHFKKLKQDLIEYCVEKKMNEITKILFRKFPNEALNIHIINLALEKGCYDYLKDGSSISRIKKILIEKSIMEKIIGFISEPATFLDAIFFLYAVRDLTLQQETQKLLHETFKDILLDPEKNCVLLYNLNPLLIFVMLCKTFHHLSKKCFHYQHSFNKYTIFFKSVASQIVEKYDHFYNLKVLTYQIFYPADEPLIRMIFEDKDLFDTLFQDDRLAKITRLQLNSFYVWDWNIFACSTSFQYSIFKRSLLNSKQERKQISNIKKNAIKNNNNNEFHLDIFANLAESIHKTLNHEKEKIGILKIFDYISKIRLEEVNNEKNHFYQYKIYFKSVAYRTLWDAIIFTGLFIYLHVNTNEFSGIRTTVAQLDTNYTSFMNSNLNYSNHENYTILESNLDSYSNLTYAIEYCAKEITLLMGTNQNQTLLEALVPPCVTFHNQEINLIASSTNLMILCYFLIITCSNVFIRKFYQIYVKKTFSLLLIDQLDLFALTWVVVLICLDAFYHQTSFFSPDEMLQDVNITSVFIALLLFTFWLHMFQYVKLLQVFGYIIKTLELLIRETYEFLWVFFLFIAAFASINLVLFGFFYSDFSGFFVGIRNLFGYALGNFSFMDDVSDYYVVMSAIINIVYILYTNVILINLLIALLSNIYQKVSDNSDLEYSHIIYQLREEKYFDKVYGSVAIYPRLFIPFLIPIHVLIFLWKNQKFNKFVGTVGYYISLCFYVILFIATHLILIPIAWANILVLILLNKYHDHLISKQVTVMSKLTHVFIWLFLGLPYLVFVLFFNDLVLFLKNAFYSSKTKKSEISCLSLLEYTSLKRLIKQLKNDKKPMNTNFFIKKYLAIATEMEMSNNSIFKKSKNLLSLRTSALLKDVKGQDTGIGIEEFEKRNNQMEIKVKKMIDIINGFSKNGQISVRIIENLMDSMRVQIKNSKMKNKIKEINKLEVINYREMEEIFLNEISNLNEKK